MKINGLITLYQKIQSCRCCPNVTCDKVLRKIEYVNTNAQVMIISEAMADNQVRLSGINFFDKEGNIGSTGNMLEKFINNFGYSVYPGNNCIYNTEIVHCFPGHQIKNCKKSIRRPTKDEIVNCIGKGFIEQEIQLIKPKIIFLMGKTSYESFYTYFLGKEKKELLPLSMKIDNIKNSKSYDKYNGIPLIPIQHASGANPRFSAMTGDKVFIDLIKRIIKKEPIGS